MSTWDDKPNDYEHALAIIERLRADWDTTKERGMDLGSSLDRLLEENLDLHAECGRLRTLNAELFKDNGECAVIIAKLERALRTIADHSPIMSDWPHSTENMQKIARAALARAKG